MPFLLTLNIVNLIFDLITHFFPVFPFAPPENLIKPKVFSCFQGKSKGNIRKRWVNAVFLLITLNIYFLAV